MAWSIPYGGHKKCKVMHVGRQTDCCEYYMGRSKLVEETLAKDLRLDIGRHEMLSTMEVCT